MIAVTVSGATPIRASRATVSRTPKPQSISTRVAPTSTSRPLPSLPLPSDAKRMPLSRAWSKRARARSLELVLQQREDLVAVGRAIRDARRVLDRDDAGRIGLSHEGAILLRFFLVVALPELELIEPAFLLGIEVGVGIAHEVQPLGTVAVDDGEAGAVEREAYAPPRPIERVVDDETAGAIAAFFDPGTRGLLRQRPPGRPRRRRRRSAA